VALLAVGDRVDVGHAVAVDRVCPEAVEVGAEAAVELVVDLGAGDPDPRDGRSPRRRPRGSW